MEIQKIQITYSELKRIYCEVIAFTKDKADWYEYPDRKTRIEQDLGLYGLDNEEFLTDFSRSFNVDFSKMEYEKYLTSESEVTNGIWILFLPLILSYYLVKLLLTYITLPFSKNVSATISSYQLPFIKATEKKDVTLGDLVASIIRKEFTEKEKLRFELKTA